MSAISKSSTSNHLPFEKAHAFTNKSLIDVKTMFQILDCFLLKLTGQLSSFTFWGCLKVTFFSSATSSACTAEDLRRFLYLLRKHSLEFYTQLLLAPEFKDTERPSCLPISSPRAHQNVMSLTLMESNVSTVDKRIYKRITKRISFLLPQDFSG